jgi:hypothetical protein
MCDSSFAFDPVYNQVSRYEVVGESGGIAPRILSFLKKRRWSISWPGGFNLGGEDIVRVQSLREASVDKSVQPLSVVAQKPLRIIDWAIAAKKTCI